MGKEYSAEKILLDDTASTVQQGANRVNVHAESQVRYWSKKFGVTPAQLRAAVANVGNLARRVETQLKRR